MTEELSAYIERCVAARNGDTQAIRPGHRVKFHWPPHPISYSYHLSSTDWTGRDAIECDGERFTVHVAETSHGYFGRCDALWHEARGESREEMLENLVAGAKPLLDRQKIIGRTLELPGRFRGSIADLKPLDHLKLLYCEDRDVASDAQSEIETHTRNGIFFESLIFILRDRRHPYRRSAQWCVLDIFESLQAFAREDKQFREAADAMKDLLWDAQDDFARSVYKAGVVLGGHIPDRGGAETLLACLAAPSRIGRRSAIHGLFHAAEWVPQDRALIEGALEEVSKSDPDRQLREFALSMAHDVASGATDHVLEPIFAGE